MADELLLLLLGASVGSFGALVGAGGGFILVPVLAMLRPGLETSSLTALALAAVAINGVSGSFAYLRQRRVDVGIALTASAAAVPGAVIGALSTERIERPVFDLMLAALLLLLAVLILRARETRHPVTQSGTSRLVTDSDGRHYAYRVRLRRVAGFSLGAGAVSSVFGIGGGIIQVPVLVGFFGVPAHVAIATSQVIVAVSAGTATIAHAVAGHLTEMVHDILFAGLGMSVGAQLGALASGRSSSVVLVRALAIALIASGARLGVRVLFG